MNKDLIEVQRKNLSNIISEIKPEKLLEVNKQFAVIYTYDAVGMEGKNKIPYEEVLRLLQTQKLTDYSERDQKEILNHIHAFDTVQQWASEQVFLDEEKLKDLHEILVKDIFQGGSYRNVNIQIIGGAHQPPDYIKVYDRMKRYYDTLDAFKGNAIEKAVYAHASLAKIHPFLDGNGRLARLVLNYHLLKAGYLPVSIPLDLRSEYIKNLEIFKVEKELDPLVKFIEKLLVNRYEKVIESLEI